MRFKLAKRHYVLVAGASLLTIAVSTTLWSNTDETGKLKHFTTDGCSSFPDGTLRDKNLWLSCCEIHDKAYWQGGTKDQRLKADQALQQCVAQVADPKLAKLMLAGVRVGGSPYWPTSFRWGYGWNYPRAYGPLNPSELKQVSTQWQLFKKPDVKPVSD